MEELKRIPVYIKPAPKKGEHHTGFKDLLIKKGSEKKCLAYLKKIAQSVYFNEIEKALNLSGKGRGMGDYIDHETLIDAVIKAHKVYKDKKTTEPLKDKIKHHEKALKLADDLANIMRELGIKKAVIHDQSITDLQISIQHKKDDIKFKHNLTKVSRSVNKTEGLTHGQVIFIRWLYVYLAIDYPNKLFTGLITALTSCIFNEALAAETVKSNLVGARVNLDKQANHLRNEKKTTHKKLFPEIYTPRKVI